MKQIINCSCEKEGALLIILTESQKHELQDYAIRKGITLKMASGKENISSFKEIKSVVDELSNNGFNLTKIRKEESGHYIMSCENNETSTNFFNGHAYEAATFTYSIKKDAEFKTQICSVIIYFSWQISPEAEYRVRCFVQSGIFGYGVTSGTTNVSSDKATYILGSQEVTLTVNYNNNTLSENYITTFYCNNEGKVRLVLHKACV